MNSMQKQHAMTQHSYGKTQVRLTKVAHHKNRYDLIELTADIELEGEFQSAYQDGDNRLIVPTDTMKNTLYVLAQQSGVPSLESFGCTVVNHFLDCYAHVTQVSLRLREHPWKRIRVDGKRHPHAFCASGGEYFTSTVCSDRTKLTITSGIDGLAVLKTTSSEFKTFSKISTQRLRRPKIGSWPPQLQPIGITAMQMANGRLIVDKYAKHC